jgi:hypothetical protein
MLEERMVTETYRLRTFWQQKSLAVQWDRVVNTRTFTSRQTANLPFLAVRPIATYSYFLAMSSVPSYLAILSYLSTLSLCI